MILDVLYIKGEIDPTLAFRRSCRRPVCGSCAGWVGERSPPRVMTAIAISPCPPARCPTSPPSPRNRTQPYLQTRDARAAEEWSRPRTADGTKCIVCASAPPPARPTCPPSTAARALQAYRWIVLARCFADGATSASIPGSTAAAPSPRRYEGAEAPARRRADQAGQQAVGMSAMFEGAEQASGGRARLVKLEFKPIAAWPPQRLRHGRGHSASSLQAAYLAVQAAARRFEWKEPAC